MIELKEVHLFNGMGIAIQEALTHAAIQRELVQVSERGVGKTYNLIEFAKKHDLIVIEPTQVMVNAMRVQHGYTKIISEHELIRGRSHIGKAVIDEGVNYDRVKHHADIVTGYY